MFVVAEFHLYRIVKNNFLRNLRFIKYFIESLKNIHKIQIQNKIINDVVSKNNFSLFR